MIALVVEKFWFVFLPLAFYTLWLFALSRRTGEDRKRVAEHIKSGLLFWAIALTVGLMIGAFLWWGMSQQSSGAVRYVPAVLTQGGIISGHTEPVQP
jgi:hypothetical protein